MPHRVFGTARKRSRAHRTARWFCRVFSLVSPGDMETISLPLTCGTTILGSRSACPLPRPWRPSPSAPNWRWVSGGRSGRTTADSGPDLPGTGQANVRLRSSCSPTRLCAGTARPGGGIGPGRAGTERQGAGGWDIHAPQGTGPLVEAAPTGPAAEPLVAERGAAFPPGRGRGWTVGTSHQRPLALPGMRLAEPSAP